MLGEPLGQMGSDESSAAGDENVLISNLHHRSGAATLGMRLTRSVRAIRNLLVASGRASKPVARVKNLIESRNKLGCDRQTIEQSQQPIEGSSRPWRNANQHRID